jgi:hypothetical protein
MPFFYNLAAASMAGISRPPKQSPQRTPEQKAKQRAYRWAYRQRPEVKAKRRAEARAYRQKHREQIKARQPPGELPSRRQSGGLIGNAPKSKQSGGQRRAPTAINIAGKLTLGSGPIIETEILT